MELTDVKRCTYDLATGNVDYYIHAIQHVNSKKENAVVGDLLEMVDLDTKNLWALTDLTGTITRYAPINDVRVNTREQP